MDQKILVDTESDDYRSALNHACRTRHLTHWAAHQLLKSSKLDLEATLAEARAAAEAEAATDVEPTNTPKKK